MRSLCAATRNPMVEGTCLRKLVRPPLTGENSVREWIRRVRMSEALLAVEGLVNREKKVAESCVGVRKPDSGSVRRMPSMRRVCRTVRGREVGSVRTSPDDAIALERKSEGFAEQVQEGC